MKTNLKIEKDSVVLNINPKLYALETIYSAAYVFLDRAYVLLDGDPKKEILVKLKAKNKENLKNLGGDFLNELINYADYQRRAKQTKKIREMLLQRAIATNDSPVVESKEEEIDLDDLDDDFLDDPEGIAIPWEEKYGKKSKVKKSKSKPKKK
jgi:His-Xaa-Ser system protein HxsD